MRLWPLFLLTNVFTAMSCGNNVDSQVIAPRVADNLHLDSALHLELETLASYSESFASTICSLQADSKNPKQALLWIQKMRNADAEEDQSLLFWNGEKSLKQSEEIVASEPLLAISNILNSKAYKIHGKRVDELNVVPEIFELKTNPFRQKPAKLSLKNPDAAAPGDQSTPVVFWGKECGTPTKIHKLDEDAILLLSATGQSTSLLNYGSDGAVHWKTVLVPFVEGTQPEFYSRPLLAVSKDKDIAVAFRLNHAQFPAFAKLHDFEFTPWQHKARSLAILAHISNDGQIQNIQILEEAFLSSLAWVDASTVAVGTTRYVNSINQPTLHLVSFAQDTPSHEYFLIPMSSKSARVTGLVGLTAGRLLVLGSVGFSQVGSGSITEPGKAFAGVFDLKTRKFVATQQWGERRNNVVTAYSVDSNGDVLLASLEDAWITHDNGKDRHSHVVLYRLVIPSAARDLRLSSFVSRNNQD